MYDLVPVSNTSVIDCNDNSFRVIAVTPACNVFEHKHAFPLQSLAIAKASQIYTAKVINLAYWQLPTFDTSLLSCDCGNVSLGDGFDDHTTSSGACRCCGGNNYQEYYNNDHGPRVVHGDMWKWHGQGSWACVTTNAEIKKDGTAVMGAGIAKIAAQRYPDLPRLLAEHLKKVGNHVQIFPQFKLFSFPTKQNWRDPSKIDIIQRSCEELLKKMDAHPQITEVLLPRPGCQNGKLEWVEVYPVIHDLLDHRIGIIALPQN